MKILLLGSLISDWQMEWLNNNSKVKASIAPVNYETMLAKGLVENGANLEAISVPAVAAFPNSIFKRIKNKKETVFNSIIIDWVPYINIQGLKQLTIKRNTRKILKKWLEDNKNVDDKIVLMYSIYPPYSEPAIKLCKKYNCHLSVVIADLPEYMYSWKKLSGFKGWYSQMISEKMVKLQNKCDSYILFTKPMATRMRIEDKPYIVSEGFFDMTVFNDVQSQEKYPVKTIVYGGNLSKLYGIRNLVKGFMQTDLPVEFHLYGAGPDSTFIEECAKRDSRIKFFGRVDRKTLLIALKKAHLCVVNKPTSDDYSNYSFSSKILEYIGSGTPLLTTKVGGMPEEYLKYVYIIDDESVEGISKALSEVISKDSTELSLFGKKAANFAATNKNYLSMTNMILSFLCTQIREDA